jgi:UDP-3-O-acyl-N-acetylglucosamine deacetylase
LAQGGSLDNAVVVERARVLNPAGLRMPDEFARHKLLDAVGDLGLAGASIWGRFIGHRSGHTLNNRLLRALFANPLAWREVIEPLAQAGIPIFAISTYERDYVLVKSVDLRRAVRALGAAGHEEMD